MQQNLKLTKVELANTPIPIWVPDEVLQKIRWLCKERPRLEWSGVLFYEITKGTIKGGAKDLEITLKDVLLMDIGTSGHTAYNFDEDVAGYMMDNPDILEKEYKIGHIHSHNTMGVFFSGEDWSELEDNVANHNFYLSVIVNNFMDIEAKIVFTAKPITKKQAPRFACMDEQGDPYELTVEFKEEENPPVQMFVYKTEIKKAPDALTVSEEFAARLGIVEKKKEEIEARLKKEKEEKEAKEKEEKEKQGGATGGGTLVKRLPYHGNGKGSEDAWNGGKSIQEDKDFKENYDPTTMSVEEQFTCFMLRLGQEVPKDFVESALDDIESACLGEATYCKVIQTLFTEWFLEFFEGSEEWQGEEKCLTMMKRVRDTLQEYISAPYAYNFLPNLLIAINRLGLEFQKLVEGKGKPAEDKKENKKNNKVKS